MVCPWLGIRGSTPQTTVLQGRDGKMKENVQEPIALGVGWRGWRGPYGGADGMIGVKLQIEQTMRWLRYMGELKNFSPSAHPSHVSFVKTIKVEYCRLVNSSKDQLKGHFFPSTQRTEMKGASSTSNERIHDADVRGGHIAEIRAGARPRPPARVVAGSRGSDERPHCNLYGVGRRISRKLLARHWGPAPSVKCPLFVSQCTVIPQSL